LADTSATQCPGTDSGEVPEPTPTSTPSKHRSRTALRRVLRWFGLGFAALIGLFVSWALFWTFYNPTVDQAAPRVIHRTPLDPDEVTVVLGGDFAPTDVSLRVIQRRGYRYPYRRTARILRDADVSFLNLEAPVTTSTRQFPLYKKYVYRVRPRATAAWQWLGLDLVSLANNHMLDYRSRGLTDTVKHLDRASIAHVGAGRNESAARRPVIFDVGGTRIGFLAYLESRIFWNLYLRTYAVGDRVGCARFERTDVARDVKRLRPLVDVLIVSVHWGDNYVGVSDAQKRAGRWLASLGVDVVAGHHSHDVQGMEVRGRRVILYSLGNYAWGTPGHGHMRIGLLARLRITPRKGDEPGRLRGVELLPIVTQNRIVRFSPRRLRPGELRWLDPFLKSSRKLGARLTVAGTTVNVGLD